MRLLAGVAALGIALVGSGCDAQLRPIAVPTGPFLVAANQRSGVATIVELATGAVTHTTLGAKPHEVAISPDARVAVLTVPTAMIGSARAIIVVDLTRTSVPRRVPLPGIREPHGIAFLGDSVALIGDLSGTTAVYVTVRDGRVRRSVAGLPANPYIVALTTTGRAYVSSPSSSKVSELDVASGRVLRTIAIDDDPAGIAVSADGRELYAAVWKEGTGGGIAIYDLERGVVAAKLPATQPRRITVTADGRHVVASDHGHVRIVDRASRQVRSVALGRNAFGSGVTCTPDSARCYVALSQAGEIVEVDVAGARVLRRFRAQPGVDGLAYVRR